MLLIALVAIVTWSFTATNEILENKVTDSKLETKVVCLNGEEVTIYDLGDEMGFYTIPIVWVGNAEYPGNMGYQQVRDNTRAYYQSTWGMSTFYQVIDMNHEVWGFNSSTGAPATDVEAAIGKDDTVNVDDD